MTDLDKYDAVNATTTLEELAETIQSFADENRQIQGRNRTFNADKMAIACRNFSKLPPNVLTRNYGIRQQAMMLSYYEALENASKALNFIQEYRMKDNDE